MEKLNLEDRKEQLLSKIEDTADWRAGKAEQYLDDKRNGMSSEALRKLYDYVEHLPKEHPIFEYYESLNDVDVLEEFNYKLSRHGFSMEKEYPEDFVQMILKENN